MPLNLVTLMLGNVVLVRLVISIMPTEVGAEGGWLVTRGSCLGVTLAEVGGGTNTPGPRAPIGPIPGDSSWCRPELSLELPLLPLSLGGGLNLLTKVGELSLLAVSGAELSMLAM